VRHAKPLATWLAFADKLPQIGLSICSEVSIPETEKGAGDPRVIAVTLLLRTISNFRGAIALTRARRVVEARVLTRCCFENIFYMNELTSKGDAFVREMRDDDRKSRKSLGELVLSEELTLDTAVKERIRAHLREIKRRAPAARFLNITGVARGMLAHAEYLYRQLSLDAAHPTFTSLARYVRRVEKKMGRWYAVSMRTQWPMKRNCRRPRIGHALR
jgi:Family of unknown function (DUF5677)